MLSSVEDLLVVQDRDRRLLELCKRLDGLPQEENRARQRLDRDEKAVASAKEALQRNGVETKNLELDIETRKTTIARLKQQQFETRKNEEFRALGNEVERYEKEIDDLETQELELMEVADGLRESLEEAQRALTKSQQIVDEDLKDLATRKVHLKSEIAEVEAKRDEGLSRLGAEERDLYQRLMKKKDGLAVAAVQGGQCGGCHVRLVPATLIKVNAQSTLTQCENCGRILYPAS